MKKPYSQMTEKELDAEAEDLTVKKYVGRGRFGGETKNGHKTLFNFQGEKQQILNQLKSGR